MTTTTDEKTQAQINRLEALLPRVIDTLFDIVEGRKFVAFMSTPAPDGKGFITTVTICDDADAPGPAERYPPVDDTYGPDGPNAPAE